MFMPNYFEEMMKEAQESGLDALAMTEHFNTFRFYDIYDYLEENYTYQNGYYNINGLKLFPGMEVDVKEVGHILLIGSLGDILEIRKALDSHTQKNDFISFQGLIDLTEQYPVLKIGAHAFRESTPLHHHEPALLKRLDALDLNGKDLFEYDADAYYSRLKKFASNLDLPIVGGSDTHQFLQYASVYNDFHQDCFEVEDLRASIISEAYKITISKKLDVKVKSAVTAKKLLKEMLNEEGVIESFV